MSVTYLPTHRDQNAVAAIAQAVLDVDGGRAPGWRLERWGIGHLRASGRAHGTVVRTVVQRTGSTVWAVALYRRGDQIRAMTLTVLHPRWARDLRDQCTAADVPFLFKQWGAWAPSHGRSGDQILMWSDGTHRPDTGPPYTPAGWTNLERVGKHAAGREVDGRTWDEFPALAVPA